MSIPLIVDGLTGGRRRPRGAGILALWPTDVINLSRMSLSIPDKAHVAKAKYRRIFDSCWPYSILYALGVVTDALKPKQ